MMRGHNISRATDWHGGTPLLSAYSRAMTLFGAHIYRAGRAPLSMFALVMSVHTRAWLLSGALACADVRAHAQAPAATRPDVSAPHETLALRTADFRALQLEQRKEKRREGLWLLGWGAANTLASGATTGALHGNRVALAASVTTLSFGVINALLALGLLDLGGAERGRIGNAASSADDLLRQRDDAAHAQRRSAQVFALNAGLDIAYIAAGTLLTLLASGHGRSAEWERGSGVAMAGQGGFLLGFDAVCWWRSNRRARQLLALPRGP